MGDIQVELNIPPRNLQNDVWERWNGRCYMIESIAAQEQALCAYTAEYDLPTMLTVNQWGSWKRPCLLYPLLRNWRGRWAPHLHLMSSPSSESLSTDEADEGITKMKGLLLEAGNRCFRDVESEPLYSVAVRLDARYKGRYVGFLWTLFNMILLHMCVCERERFTHPNPTLSVCVCVWNF